MRITPAELISQLSTTVDPSFARATVESYVELQQRFVVGDWGPAELDGGRLCEAVSKCLHQLDTGTVNHTVSPGEVRKRLLNEDVEHAIGKKDRQHIAKVIELVYKFRSERGAVHISPDHSANAIDSVLVLHAGKWILGEFLRLAWNQDHKVVGETISQLAQLEFSLIHELDGRPMVTARTITAPEEILLLLNHAVTHRMSRSQLRELMPNQNPKTVSNTILRLLSLREIRDAGNGEVALAPPGQKRVMEVIVPKYGTAT